MIKYIFTNSKIIPELKHSKYTIENKFNLTAVSLSYSRTSLKQIIMN